MNSFLSGAVSMGFLVAGLFFVRYWRSSGDRLFLYFAAAFFVMMLERIIRESFSLTNEWQPYVYVIRLAAFVLLLVGIIDKNRRVG